MAKLAPDYAGLLARHAKIHGALFGRMRLDLGGGADHALTTEELLAKTTDAEPSRALIEKEFDAGRYNIISSTGELPPNLQGVWGGTYDPALGQRLHPQRQRPLGHRRQPDGQHARADAGLHVLHRVARPLAGDQREALFGARGIVLPSRSTTHGYNNAFAAEFPGGILGRRAPAWAAHFFYDYYLYTGDREFLAGHALPFMEKAALFFEDYLYEGPDGKYVFTPTQSPENTPGNTKSQVTFNATMDVAVAKELLRNTIAASRELGVNADKIPVWEKMLAKMPDYMIDEDGSIKEWLTPRLDEQRRPPPLLAALSALRRHAGGDRPEPRAAGRVQAAASSSSSTATGQRDNQSGFMSFGLVQLGQAAASLGEGELAYRCLVHLVNRFWLQQPRLDAQRQVAVQHGHQRRHAGGDHQDAGGFGSRRRSGCCPPARQPGPRGRSKASCAAARSRSSAWPGTARRSRRPSLGQGAGHPAVRARGDRHGGRHEGRGWDPGRGRREEPHALACPPAGRSRSRSG